jgi:hypothetical protein
MVLMLSTGTALRSLEEEQKNAMPAMVDGSKVSRST